MRWVVDGGNVIGSRPTGWWRDRPGAMRELVEALDSLAERSGDPVTVVSTTARSSLRRPARDRAVRVASSAERGRRRIAALVESNPDPADLSVVTSTATSPGASAMPRPRWGAGEFRRRLDG